MTTKSGNRLGEETSPYLLQHADNPVDWYPWGEEALSRARREDKPILLSIGYSACHWCHVMAHESFEDEETAALMNRYFINVKVDREERPDLDKIYQLSHQILAQRGGGWPLTMFLAPNDLTPFFGGTYFPKEPRYGMPAFREILEKICDFYASNKQELLRQNQALRNVFEKLDAAENDEQEPLSDLPLFEARRILEAEFDSRFGGFGSAPKFPGCNNLEFLVFYAQHSEARFDPDKPAVRMSLYTLKRIAEGGIHDHLGGGFCRYSVDQQWMIPHFEKMLYDNGPLLGLYALAWRITKNPVFKNAANGIANWVIREMQFEEGGYFSALDADSEGEEGKYYVWTKEGIEKHLSADEKEVFTPRFGLDSAPNFEGKWHLHARSEIPELAKQLGKTEQDLREILDRAREKLFSVREQRQRPGRDDKILTAWNGLMISGMACAGRLLDDPKLIDSATRTVDFIRNNLWRDGRLFASHKDGRARFNAYLDDYAFLAYGLLELLQARWRSEDFTFAVELADALLENFLDQELGGFYFTSHDHEQLIHRPKPFGDDATPSGNAVATRVLLRLGYLLGETHYVDAAEECLIAAWNTVRSAPHVHATMLMALQEFLQPPECVIVRGSPQLMKMWHDYLDDHAFMSRLVLRIPPDEKDLPHGIAIREPRGDCVAYICKGTTCSPPITDRSGLLETATGRHVGDQL
ncbi:MAG: thioredoxin domain-containing protein [Gammaproteobacteria bacterium]|nr:thioredoxin domain-containing protein [Gammaproteobacteria bacterium]